MSKIYDLIMESEEKVYQCNDCGKEFEDPVEGCCPYCGCGDIIEDVYLEDEDLTSEQEENIEDIAYIWWNTKDTPEESAEWYWNNNSEGELKKLPYEKFKELFVKYSKESQAAAEQDKKDREEHNKKVDEERKQWEEKCKSITKEPDLDTLVRAVKSYVYDEPDNWSNTDDNSNLNNAFFQNYIDFKAENLSNETKKKLLDAMHGQISAQYSARYPDMNI